MRRAEHPARTGVPNFSQTALMLQTAAPRFARLATGDLWSAVERLTVGHRARLGNVVHSCARVAVPVWPAVPPSRARMPPRSGKYWSLRSPSPVAEAGLPADLVHPAMARRAHRGHRSAVEPIGGAVSATVRGCKKVDSQTAQLERRSVCSPRWATGGCIPRRLPPSVDLPPEAGHLD